MKNYELFKVEESVETRKIRKEAKKQSLPLGWLIRASIRSYFKEQKQLKKEEDARN